MTASCLLPRLPIPVLRTAHLRRTAAWYREVLGFRQVQRVPGTVALLRLGWVEFQLWQVPEVTGAQECCIALDARRIGVFECHAQLAREARAWIGPTPVLQPWGAWEFCVQDGDGSRLRFVQWANAPLPAAEVPARHGAGRLSRGGRMEQ